MVRTITNSLDLLTSHFIHCVISLCEKSFVSKKSCQLEGLTASFKDVVKLLSTNIWSFERPKIFVRSVLFGSPSNLLVQFFPPSSSTKHVNSNSMWHSVRGGGGLSEYLNIVIMRSPKLRNEPNTIMTYPNVKWLTESNYYVSLEFILLPYLVTHSTPPLPDQNVTYYYYLRETHSTRCQIYCYFHLSLVNHSEHYQFWRQHQTDLAGTLNLN